LLPNSEIWVAQLCGWGQANSTVPVGPAAKDRVDTLHSFNPFILSSFTSTDSLDTDTLIEQPHRDAGKSVDGSVGSRLERSP